MVEYVDNELLTGILKCIGEDEDKEIVDIINNICPKKKLKKQTDDIINIDAKIKKKLKNESKSLLDYLVLSQKLVDDYLEELQIPTKIDFVNREECADNSKLSEIRKQFLNIAKKFIDVDIIKETISKKCCVNVEGNVCTVCGKEFPQLNLSTEYKDTSRINVVQPVNYERKLHFKDALNQFQGKQNTNIPRSVFISIHQKLLDNGLIKKGKTKEESYEKVEFYHIRKFLQETKNSKQYENCYYIFHLITGKKLFDLTDIESKLYEDFDELCKTFDSLNFERTNFLNAQFVIYQLLNKNGVRISENYFNMIKTDGRRLLYNEMYSKCCEKLNWDWIEL